MKKITIFILLVLGAANLFGQNKTNEEILLPPPYIITSDTSASYISLPDSNWQIMADPSGNLTLQKVLQSREFQNAGNKIDYNFKTYWLRYRLANRMAKDAQVTFWFTNIAYSTLYVKTDGGDWQTYRSGDLVPYSKRDGLKSLMTVTLSIPARESLVVYQKNTYSNLIPFYQANPTTGFSFSKWVTHRQRAKYINSVLLSFVLGLLLIAIAINLYFYTIVREKEFLFFTLFILSFGVVWGVGLDDIFLKEYPYAIYYLSYIFSPFINFFLVFSVRHFLKTFTWFPRWDIYLITICIIDVLTEFLMGFVTVITHTSPTTALTYAYLIPVILIQLSLLFTVFLYRSHKDKIVRLVVYAYVPFCITLAEQFVFVFLNNTGLFKNGGSFIAKYSVVHTWINDHLLYPLSLAWMFVLFAGVLLMRFSVLRRKYAQEKLEREQERTAMVEQQKAELEKQVIARTLELQQSLENLKSTQSQLIQSEKMASLGELTAGIAHEIQNPLNFVNNFSEVNKEMLEELKTERLKPNAERDDALQNELINDVITNEEKINHHGKRADAIVKGMLQHSRTSSGQKEPTDINALCDEYLRLSYHGMRAKDKSFNATMETDFDNTIGKINIISQDIGRVLLNLFNNAFYACAERNRASTSSAGQTYEPTVTVKTSKTPSPLERGRDEVAIIIKDNGNGIPQNIIDKIFQPFFTTKPTGSGTGLGLSLSYDIIKAHGGEIKVESREGEGTEFIVSLSV